MASSAALPRRDQRRSSAGIRLRLPVVCLFVCLASCLASGLAPCLAPCLAQDARAASWGPALPGIERRLPATESSALTLALTLDACMGGYDAALIAWLRGQGVPATLFVTSIWIRRHPEAFQELAADPLFEIAAHGERHRPASVTGRGAYGIRGTGSANELIREVEDNATLIQNLTGRRPRWFRAGTAYYDEEAVRVIRKLGFGIAGFSVSGDGGARLPARKVAERLLAVKSGDIILCHMNKPESGAREGLQAALPRLLDRGARFVRLSEVRE
jgi:peptidoglycan/xylan/chitin deacetylase (PgdA/CDA1 family)